MTFFVKMESTKISGIGELHYWCSQPLLHVSYFTKFYPKGFVRVNHIYEFKKVLEFCLAATEHKTNQKVTEVTDNIYSGLLTANTSVEHK